jgi:xylulose-5-phosphate/fructose-6-phosphate phosphoketolase
LLRRYSARSGANSPVSLESGPTATAWHAAKYIDPVESGAVIPIVHVNGFKISERTIYGCMDDKEMVTLFTGYGYQCRFVEDLEDIVSIFSLNDNV